MRFRFVNALWVFTIAFVVGLCGVLIFQNCFLSDDDVAAIVNSAHAVEEPEPEWKRDPIIKQTRPFYIEYLCNVRSDRIEAVFRLTNVNSETAYFELDRKKGKLPSLVSNAIPWGMRVLSRIEKSSLSPLASTRLYVPVPPEAMFFELSFGVSSGKPNRMRTVIWSSYPPRPPECASLPPYDREVRISVRPFNGLIIPRFLIHVPLAASSEVEVMPCAWHTRPSFRPSKFEAFVSRARYLRFSFELYTRRTAFEDWC